MPAPGFMPTVQCEGKNRHTGLPCKSRAVRGAKYCRAHGVMAPNAQAKAAQNVAVWKALHHTDARHPLEIMQQVLHVMDFLFQDALRTLQESEGTHPTLVANLVERAQNVSRQARETLQSGALAYFVNKAKTDGAELARIVNVALGYAELDEVSESRVRAALRRALEEESGRKGERLAIEGHVVSSNGSK